MDYEKKYNEDLEQAAKEYCPDDAYPFASDIINKEVRKAFIAGYNLCKEQMLKEAVEGEVICYNDDTYSVESYCFDNKEHHHHSGDKVRIIIVKEDEK